MRSDERAGGPPKIEILNALETICASEHFVRAPQLQQFLKFIVTHSISGQERHLKAYTIAVEALGRSSDFDPDKNSIVRVEAVRLRRALDLYYKTQGQDDRVRITLPAGSYVPLFEASAGAPAGAPSRPWARLRKPMSVVAILALLLLVGVGVSLEILRNRASGPAAPEPAAISDEAERTAPISLPPGNGMPTILIQPAVIIGSPPPNSMMQGLHFNIGNAFARFETINVIYSAGPATVTASSSPSDKTSAPPHPDYRLMGAVEYRTGETEMRFTLIDTADETVVWSWKLVRPENAEPRAVDEHVVRTLATTLMSSFGVIRARDWAKQLMSNAGDPRYRCILLASAALRSEGSGDRDRARACLEQLTSVDPSFDPGYSYLASIYNRDYERGRILHSGDTHALDKALSAGRRAIELNPESARAYLSLFVTHFDRRDFDAAFAAIAKSERLNPYEPLTFDIHGARLISVGKVDEGLKIMAKGGDLHSVRPCTFAFYVFLAYHLKGDRAEAAQHAAQLTCKAHPFGFIARALVASAAGDKDGARQAVDRLVAQLPMWRDDPGDALDRLFPNPEVAGRIEHDLVAAGLHLHRIGATTSQP